MPILPLILRSKATWLVLLVAVGFAAAYHYRGLIARNADLVAQVVRLQIANEEIGYQLEAERTAAAIAIRERQAAQRALDALRAERAADTDPEYIEWSQQRVPPTERARLCAATGADGCER